MKIEYVKISLGGSTSWLDAVDVAQGTAQKI
jgi:hypothetical protein